MSLPTRQLQVLEQIDLALQSADPRLKGLFATFTRLTARDAMPDAETIHARTPRLAALISIMAVAVLAGVLLGAITATPGCAPARSTGAAVARTGICRDGLAGRSLAGR